MDNIIEPNENFDFSKLTLAHPVAIQGNAYFTKLEKDKKPLYIQTPKSLTRQGIVKSGKKYYCDLMFDKSATMFINWLEILEEKCQELIFEKSEHWFQGSLEKGDVENAFNPLIRVYKSGKYYLLRTNIKTNKDDNPALKIYNDREVSLTIESIQSDTEVISILEIHGIKFTSRNFQIEMELKQIMVVDDEKIFDSCLIKKRSHQTDINSANEILHHDNILEKPLEKIENINNTENNNEIIEETNNLSELENIDFVDNVEIKNDESNNHLENTFDEYNTETLDKSEILDKNVHPIEDAECLLDNLEEINITDMIEDVPEPKESITIEFEDLNKKNSNETINEIQSVEVDNDVINLKKPNQVYFDIYKQAIKKAKEAKKTAILAYLEAKNIKQTYMLENINDSDSDCEFDAEIDDVSESELEGL